MSRPGSTSAIFPCISSVTRICRPIRSARCGASWISPAGRWTTAHCGAPSAFADFAQLRQQEQDKGFREAPRPFGGGDFFRRGKSGAWRDELTAEQVKRVEVDHADMMRRLGYELTSPSLALTG